MTDALSENSAHEELNAALSNYLKYYQTLNSPRFAVLVTGQWGTGKTHLVKQILPSEGDGSSAIYVSMFGKKTPEDIIAAVFAEMYPTVSEFRSLIEKFGDSVKSVSVFGVGLGGQAAAGLLSAFLTKNIDTSKTIIFDDLERSTIDQKILLGIINYYVEYKKCRVVVIAHDDKLVECFNESKEKIFGQTIRVVPDRYSAFTVFVGELIDTNAKEFVGRYRDIILNCLKQSGVLSLRILRHVMFDIARIFELLDDAHRKNEAAMLDLVYTFAAWDFEIRAGRLSDKDLARRGGFPIESPNEKTPFEEAKRRYHQNALTSNILNNDVLTQTLICGRYDKSAICSSINNSSFFVKSHELPLWRKPMQFMTLSDNIVDAALLEIQNQLDARNIEDFGVMLHIFAFRMMMATHEIIDISIGDVEFESKKYIDDLAAADRLGARHYDEFDDPSRWDNAHGIMFWVEDNYRDNFNRIVTYLRTKSHEALNKTYPAAAKELLNKLERNALAFCCRNFVYWRR